MIACATYRMMHQTAGLIFACPEWSVVRFRNRFGNVTTRTPDGWRDLIITIMYKGFLFEVQLAHSAMVKCCQKLGTNRASTSPCVHFRIVFTCRNVPTCTNLPRLQRKGMCKNVATAVLYMLSIRDCCECANANVFDIILPNPVSLFIFPCQAFLRTRYLVELSTVCAIHDCSATSLLHCRDIAPFRDRCHG